MAYELWEKMNTPISVRKPARPAVRRDIPVTVGPVAVAEAPSGSMQFLGAGRLNRALQFADCPPEHVLILREADALTARYIQIARAAGWDLEGARA